MPFFLGARLWRLRADESLLSSIFAPEPIWFFRFQILEVVSRSCIKGLLLPR